MGASSSLDEAEAGSRGILTCGCCTPRGYQSRLTHNAKEKRIYRTRRWRKEDQRPSGVNCARDQVPSVRYRRPRTAKPIIDKGNRATDRKVLREQEDEKALEREKEKSKMQPGNRSEGSL